MRSQNPKNRKRPLIAAALAVLMVLCLFVNALPEKSYAETSRFTLTGATYPTTLSLGTPFTLKGTLKGTNTITRVDVGVLDKSSGKYVSGFHFYKTGLSTKSYSISNADSSLKFGNLSAGEYYYVIKGTDSKGTQTVLKKSFTVTDPNARFTVTGATYPSTLKKGTPFTLKGTLKGTNKITRVDVGVLKKSTGAYVSGFHFYKTGLSTKSYSIANADSSLKFGNLPAGSYYYVIKAKDSKGTQTVLKKAFTVTDPNASTARFKVTGATYPTTLKKGTSFTLKGTLTGTNKITRVDVGVLKKSTGAYVSGFHFYKTGLSTKSYSIANADSSLKFGKLPAGSYYYVIKAKDSKGTQTVLKKAFTVTDPNAQTARFKVTGATYPKTLKKGDSFTLKGTLTGTNKITRVDVGVLKKSTGKYVTGYHYYKTGLSTKTYDIAKADSSLKFGSLPAGEYYYVIKATDSKGLQTVLKKAFTVTDPNASTRFKVTGATYPTTLKKGTSFTLKGTLTCTNKMTRVVIGVVSKKTGKYVSGFYFNKTGLSTKTYDIAKADSSLKFGTLPEGEYYYRVTGYDSVGSVKVLNKAFSVKAETSGMTDAEFKADLKEQGFPTAYITPLMTLHKAHPSWVFYADNTGISWSTLLSKEKVIGRSLIEPSASAAYINQDYKNKNYDGNLKVASDAAIAYYLDPRNFLKEKDIYQFLDQRSEYNPGTKAQVTSLVSQNNCFMNTSTYINTLVKAGKNAGVNPAVLTVMVIQEQGWSGGSGLISGTNSTYPGIYNHFNVGAYTADGMSKIVRGLWWANGAGVGATSYGRPWNSIEKSLSGGASHYGAGYIENNQYTYYTKKYNVMNGASNVGTHQYMTNVDGAYSEGRLLRQAYTSDDTDLVFRIPVYSGMPSSPCPAP